MRIKKGLLVVIAAVLTACGTESTEKDVSKEKELVPTKDSIVSLDHKEFLKNAYQLFKEGDDEGSIAIANEVLVYGYAINNDTVIGGALASLCRNSQRSQDTVRLAELSDELAKLTASSGNPKWMMIRAHMNAEMWRLIGDMDRAEAFYNESMDISFAIDAIGMYTIDHFNKSFVSTAKGDFAEARRLISKYYALRLEADSTSEDAYGLIALAYLLEQEGNYKGAHEVACVTRRLFTEQNLFPEPPDEKPLLEVEKSVYSKLDEKTYMKIMGEAEHNDVKGLLDKFL